MRLKEGTLTSKRKPKSTPKTKNEAFEKYLKFFYDRPRIKVTISKDSTEPLYILNSYEMN